jgi:hypothetical protein
MPFVFLAEDIIGDFMKLQPFVSASSLVDRLFQFTTKSNHSIQNRKFVSDMIEGMIESQSTVLANIARSLDTNTPLRHKEKRLSRMLSKSKVPWEDLKERAIELSTRMVEQDDVIAFDPGDVIKEYAKKMEKLYRVHDGSKGECGNGYEEFSIECVQWKNGKRLHIPLYSKLINAKCEDYISQNSQICDAFQSVFEFIGDNKGIWTFDRGHDRSRIFEKIFLPFCSRMKWILRLCENRSIIPVDPESGVQGPRCGMMDLAKGIPLQEEYMRLTYPKKTGRIYLGWTRVIVEIGSFKKTLTLIVAHDKRNKDPIVILTNQLVTNEIEAIKIFGFYLERWRKEEGYRFCKTGLDLESIRTLKFNSIQNLAWLNFMAYFFVTLFHRSQPETVENMCDQELEHFKPIELVGFKYYRVLMLMGRLLKQQKQNPKVLPRVA